MARIIKGEDCISRSEAAKIADVPRKQIDAWIRDSGIANLKLRVIRVGKPASSSRIYIKKKIFLEFITCKRTCDAIRALFTNPPKVQQRDAGGTRIFRRRIVGHHWDTPVRY